MPDDKMFSCYDFDISEIVDIKPLKHHNFEHISLGERYVLWQRFNSYYGKLFLMNVAGKDYKISYLLADETNEDFYIHKVKYKILLEYFYALLKSFIKCTDVIVTNQFFVAMIALSLEKHVFWIKDKFAKKQKSASEVLKNYNKVIQLPVNFNVQKNIAEFLQNMRPKSNISEEEFLSANPFPLVDIELKTIAPKANNKNPVKIVFTTDENYAIMTGVAIQSAITNKNANSVYEITVVGYRLSNFSRCCFACLEQIDARINIINVDDMEKFKDIKQTRHINQTALLIFDLPEILSDFDKVLYLDGDIFVQGDLQKLYNTNIRNNYAGVVKSAGLLRPERHKMQSKCSNDNYFNGGVILMNLEKMRQDNVSEKMLAWKKKNESFFMNQDALNMILSPNVKLMSCWYNFLAYYPFSFPRKSLEKFYNVSLPKDVVAIYKKALILHYPGKVKPYKENMGYLTEEFLKYLQKTEFMRLMLLN